MVDRVTALSTYVFDPSYGTLEKAKSNPYKPVEQAWEDDHLFGVGQYVFAAGQEVVIQHVAGVSQTDWTDY